MASREGDIRLAQRLIQDLDVPAEAAFERTEIFSMTLWYVTPDGTRRM